MNVLLIFNDAFIFYKSLLRELYSRKDCLYLEKISVVALIHYILKVSKVIAYFSSVGASNYQLSSTYFT